MTSKTTQQPDLMAIVTELTELENERRWAKERVDRATKRIEELTPAVLAAFDAAGMKRLTMNGLTVSPRCDRYLKYVNGSNTADVTEALADMPDMSYLVKPSYNGNALKSAVLEIVDAGGDIPSMLASLIEISEQFKVSFRAAE